MGDRDRTGMASLDGLNLDHPRVTDSASDAKIRDALYKLRREQGERRASSRTKVRLEDGAALLTCGYGM